MDTFSQVNCLTKHVFLDPILCSFNIHTLFLLSNRIMGLIIDLQVIYYSPTFKPDNNAILEIWAGHNYTSGPLEAAVAGIKVHFFE